MSTVQSTSLPDNAPAGSTDLSDRELLQRIADESSRICAQAAPNKGGGQLRSPPVAATAGCRCHGCGATAGGSVIGGQLVEICDTCILAWVIDNVPGLADSVANHFRKPENAKGLRGLLKRIGLDTALEAVAASAGEAKDRYQRFDPTLIVGGRGRAWQQVQQHATGAMHSANAIIEQEREDAAARHLERIRQNEMHERAHEEFEQSRREAVLGRPDRFEPV